MLTDPDQSATTVKKTGHYRNQCRLLKKLLKQTENSQNNPGSKNSGANNSNPNSNVNNDNNNDNNNHKNSNTVKWKLKTVYTPCETYGKRNQFTEKSYFGANAANLPPLGTEDRKDKIKSKREPIKMILTNLIKLQPKI